MCIQIKYGTITVSNTKLGVFIMKKHHMVYDVQEELRIRSVKDVAAKLTYAEDVHTQGIINFINQDNDVIRHFIVDNVSWFDQQAAILQYFDSVVDGYNRNAVIKILNSYGYRCREDKCFLSYTVYPLMPSLIFALIICLGNSLPLFTSVMVTILIYTFIAMIPFTYVMLYESKRETQYE